MSPGAIGRPHPRSSWRDGDSQASGAGIFSFWMLQPGTCSGSLLSRDQDPNLARETDTSPAGFGRCMPGPVCISCEVTEAGVSGWRREKKAGRAGGSAQQAGPRLPVLGVGGMRGKGVQGKTSSVAPIEREVGVAIRAQGSGPVTRDTKSTGCPSPLTRVRAPGPRGTTQSCGESQEQKFKRPAICLTLVLSRLDEFWFSDGSLSDKTKCADPGLMPLPDAGTGLDWSHLVDAARAFEGKDSPTLGWQPGGRLSSRGVWASVLDAHTSLRMEL